MGAAANAAVVAVSMNRRRLFCLPHALLTPLMPREQKRKWMFETENPNWSDYEILRANASNLFKAKGERFRAPGEWARLPGVKFDL
jgi:hypothetical protein